MGFLDLLAFYYVVFLVFLLCKTLPGIVQSCYQYIKITYFRNWYQDLDIKRCDISSVSNCVEEVQCQWRIPKFLNMISNGVGHAVYSDVLTLNIGENIDTYKLVLFPNGFNEGGKSYASLYLEKTSSKERLINFSCAIIDAEGRQLLKKNHKQILGIHRFLGWKRFCRSSIFLEEGALKDNNLRMMCTLQIFDDDALKNHDTVDNDQRTRILLSELSIDLGSLIKEENYYDFTLIVQNENLHVHKAILSARSPVFKALFNSPLTEKNCVEITDISKLTFQELLNYIYSGKFSDLNLQEAIDLYYAADKYELVSLKNLCSNVIMQNLKVNNVLDALMLSVKHSDWELREFCIRYIVKNAPKVETQKEWFLLFENQPKLAQLIVKRIVFYSNFKCHYNIIERLRIKRDKSIKT